MQTIGIGELQKNMGILTHLNEALKIVDKRKNKDIAIVYPLKEKDTSITDKLAGSFSKYAKKIPDNKSMDEIRQEAMEMALMEKYGDKYGLSD
jgi:hypothetical protein